MTRKRRKPSPQREAMRFLIEDFAAVPPDEDVGEAPGALQKEAARLLLPGSAKGPSPQQRILLKMPPAAFQGLRRMIAGYLRGLAVNGSVGPHKVRISIRISADAKPGDPLYVEPSIDSVTTGTQDLVWFYVADLVHRVGPSQIGICPAPRSKRSPGRSAYCENLFLRRGQKRFCSDTCRARVATQKARGKGVDR